MSDKDADFDDNAKNADVYGRFQGSDDEDNPLLPINQDQPARQECDVELGDNFYRSPYEQNDGVYDAFIIEGGENQKVQKGQQVKKEIPLEEALVLIESKIAENTTIENKISAFKLLAEKIKESKSSQYQIDTLCGWLESMKLIDNFFHEDSHPQILRNMPTVLRFLYENGKMHSDELCMYALVGLKAQEQYVKVVQSLLGFVRVEDLCSIFELVCSQGDLENHNLASLLSNIVSNKYFFEESLIENEKKVKPSQDNNLLGEQYEIEDPLQHRNYHEQTQIKADNESSREATKMLALNLFKFLIEATENHMTTFYPTLSKLLTSKHVFLCSELASTLPQLLKKGKTNAIWILEHCLKVDFGMSSKLKGSKNMARFNFIQKLVNEHLYEYLLILLARVRFNKAVVDKILNIFILLSKNYRPLDDFYTQYIWKILGLNSREEKEREQFFSFVKDILRNESNFTEESVYFIFFQVLMNLRAEWFSLKILDCLEMLFMRLNEDLKLISYTDQTYEIQNPDLVGIDKFWYIYFNSNDPKVTKKCKEFLWKLTTYNNNGEIKRTLLEEYNSKILAFMCESPEAKRMDFCNKGFEIIDKLMEETAKKEATVQMVQLFIQNECRDAVAPKKIDLKFTQKSRLEHLREQIAQAITPSNSNIKLISKGSTLKGEKMSLKDLNLQNGNTIMVLDDQPAAKPTEQQKQNLQNMVNQVSQIFGSEMSAGLIRFIVEKMEGHDIERIIEAMMNQEKLALMTSQFNELAQKEEPKPKGMEDEGEVMADHGVKEVEQESDKDANMEMESQPQQPAVVKFSLVLSSNPTNIQQLLWCAAQSNKKKGWETIRSLPDSQSHLEQIGKQVEQRGWEALFPKEDPDEMTCAYHAHLLGHMLERGKGRGKKYMVGLGGFGYLVNWLMRLPVSTSIVIQEVSSLLVLVLEEQASVLGLFASRVAKREEKKLLQPMIEENEWICQQSGSQLVPFGDSSFIKWLINLLLTHEKDSYLPAQNIASILIYFILQSRERLVEVLELPLPQIFHMMQTHGFVGEYIFLSALSKTFIDDSEGLAVKYCEKLLNLVDYSLDYESLSGSKSNLIYTYDLVTCILEKTSQHKEKEQEIILKSIKTIAGFIDKMDVEELVSILLLLKSSILKLYPQGHSEEQERFGPAQEEMEEDFQIYVAKESGAKLQQESTPMLDENQRAVIEVALGQFAEWLFKTYLFDLEKPGKYTRDKSIRKECYQILGMVGANCPQTGQMLADSILKIEVKQRNREDDYIDFRTREYIGLTNLGATCYINSLLQQIYHTKFSKLLLQKGQTQAQQLKIKQLKKIFMQLCFSIKNVVNPRQFIKGLNFYGEPINTSVQQDATQFLLCLFDYIEGEGCQAEVHDVFGGYLCNQITVEDGGEQQFVKNNMEHFNSISVDIKGKKNLQEALAYLIKPQNLDGENKYYCEQLGKKMKASRKCYIERMPNILILTLKRFQFDFDSQSRHKLNDYFEFPFDLDMHKYSAAYLRNKEETSDSKYRLAGILVHSGSAQSGHYYSYIKIGELWFEFNDRVVSEFNVMNNLKNQCFGCSEGKKTRSAYMLFYEKAHSSYHGVYLNQVAETNLYKKQICEQNAIFLKTRLIYDENFRKMLQKLKNSTQDPRLQSFINSIFGKRLTQEQSKNEAKYPAMVHFDVDDEKAPLVGDGMDDLLDLVDRD